MQRKIIVCDPEKCTGCGICELVCSAVKEKGFNPLLSRIRVVRVGSSFNVAITCLLCEDPPCVRSCPYKALRQDEETGMIKVKEEACDGCSWCIETCEFGAILLHLDRKVVAICDLCEGDPKCVDFCPKEALKLMTPEEIGQRMRREAVKTLYAGTS